MSRIVKTLGVMLNCHFPVTCCTMPQPSLECYSAINELSVHAQLTWLPSWTWWGIPASLLRWHVTHNVMDLLAKLPTWIWSACTSGFSLCLTLKRLLWWGVSSVQVHSGATLPVCSWHTPLFPSVLSTLLTVQAWCVHMIMSVASCNDIVTPIDMSP